MLHHQETTKDFYLNQNATPMVDPTWDDDSDDLRDTRHTFNLKTLNVDPAEY